MLQEDISKTNDNFERYKERISNFSGEFELGLFLYISRKSLVWIAMFFILAFTAAKLYLRYTAPLYQASSIIQVQTNNQANQLLNIDNLSTQENSNGLAEAVELLRSKVFVKRVLSKLPLEVGYYSEGTLLNNELYTGSPFNVEVRRKDNAIVGTKIYIDFNSSSRGVVNFSVDGQSYSENYTTDKWLHFPQFDLRVFITNYPEIQKQQNTNKENVYYFTVNDTNALVNKYYPFLEVKLLNEDAKTISISFKDFNSQKAADIVSSMTEEYTNFDLERKGESSKSVIRFIDVQLDAVYEQLKSSENSIQDFKKVNNVTEDIDVKNTNTTRLNGLEDQIINLELEENVLNKIGVEINNSKAIDSYSLLAMLAGTETEANISKSVSELHRLLIQKKKCFMKLRQVAKPLKQSIFRLIFRKNY
ncbi:MAG: hypothetical protein IPP64_09820 [Bacteroidetes bacterium]|nr:hypothetical protein [Bacteroidota bacterium]